jgi:7,8-dihydropterin-6-yl-methyl-4-(beta-D-ribofuranosyl)aminobenzene 5'-phosphate synthase
MGVIANHGRFSRGVAISSIARNVIFYETDQSDTMKNRFNSRFVDSVIMTVLVDNKADLIVDSSDAVQYFTEKPLLAEHGFSALIQPGDSGETILWDAGGSDVALIENMRRMKLDFNTITKIALSHGHWDHYAAMTALLDQMKLSPMPQEWPEGVSEAELSVLLEKSQIPIIAHPAAFRERWAKKEDGTLKGPFDPPPVKRWKASGAEIIHSENPHELAPGCWVTGRIPRQSFEESGRPKNRFYRNGADFIPDDLDEDQAVVINLDEKGLIVLSGCAHSGIVNTIEYARQFTGIERVHAIIGGFHLARASEEEIEKTTAYIKDLQPTYVIPSHCTGFQATSQFAREMPDAFIEGVVGATYRF